MYVRVFRSIYVCARVYRCICMEVSMYCASVYRCICMEVSMYVRVFIGVYAWKFTCMCECLEV